MQIDTRELSSRILSSFQNDTSSENGKNFKTPKMKYRIDRQSTGFKSGKSLYYRFQGWHQGRAREP